MSIKPIDFQVMIPRTSEVAKIHNDEHSKSQMLQQQQTSTVQHKADDDVRLVHSQDKAHKAKIKEKEEKEGKNKKQEKKKNKGNYNENRKSEDIKISTIDIKI